MRVSQGGTQIWCPKCGKVTVCAAVNPSQLGEESGQRWYRTSHVDVNWFRRGRICQVCNHSFLTAELDEEFVDELVELRDSLASIRASAETYIGQSQAAALTLQKLSSSIEVLRALNAYKESGDEGSEEDLVVSAEVLLGKSLIRFSASKKLVGYRSDWGQYLALNLENKSIHVFTSPVREKIPAMFAECHVRRYEAQESRHSNLESVAPALAHGSIADYWRFEHLSDFKKFIVHFRLIK